MREGLTMPELTGIYRRIAGRYDFQHAILTARSDERGRRLLVDNAVKKGDRVLDCGAGTGATGLLAAERVGEEGRVILYDLSDAMLEVAREKAAASPLLDRIEIQIGDMVQLPFEDACFDVVTSTYSLCPLYDPVAGALEMYRVVKPGGRVAIAHSAEPGNPAVRRVADLIESVAWRIRWLSMGCRPVEVLPALVDAGGLVIFEKSIGVPLWPFWVFVVEKPVLSSSP